MSIPTILDLRLRVISIFKSQIQKKSFSRIGAKLWNEIPTKLRYLPKRTFSKRIRDLLLLLLESEDSYVDLETMISKLKMHDG